MLDIKSWDCFWGHLYLLYDGLFKYPDPECLIEQKMTTEHKKVTNYLRFKPCPAGLRKGGSQGRDFPHRVRVAVGQKGFFHPIILHFFPDFLILGINIKTN